MHFDFRETHYQIGKLNRICAAALETDLLNQFESVKFMTMIADKMTLNAPGI